VNFIVGLLIGVMATVLVMRCPFDAVWITSEWFDRQLRQGEVRAA
jgi:hypothetical protein